MSNHGTPSIPGWYIRFQSHVLERLPRPPVLDKHLAEGWLKHGEALSSALLRILMPIEVVTRLVVEVGGSTTLRNLFVPRSRECLRAYGGEEKLDDEEVLRKVIHWNIVDLLIQLSVDPQPGSRVELELFRFLHAPNEKEVRACCNEPGYDHPTFEDGLRLGIQHPEVLEGNTLVFIPRNPVMPYGRRSRKAALLVGPDSSRLGLSAMAEVFSKNTRWRPPYGSNSRLVFVRRKTA